ncbi:MAG: GNAT family N-acetyltransferase [Caldilineaceae bacterium]
MFTIRKYQAGDLDAVKQITLICFDGVSMDQNIEKRFGRVGEHDWQFRKARHIDADVAANAAGIFVAEVEGVVAGYVTTRVDAVTQIGGIPNLGVLPAYRKQGIGRALLETAITYLREQGMAYARIETLEQNPIGQQLYPSLGFQEFARQIHFIKPL